jgi:hypothetical protein
MTGAMDLSEMNRLAQETFNTVYVLYAYCMYILEAHIYIYIYACLHMYVYMCIFLYLDI